MLAATFAAAPVFSQDLQQGPKIDKLRFKVIKGAGGGGYSQIPVAELYVDGFDGAYTDWTTIGASPYLDTVDFPANYIEESQYCNIIGFFSFEDTTLGVDEFDSGTIEAYARSEDPEIDGDVYLFAGPYSWVWAGSIEAASQWSWTKTSYIFNVPSYLLDPALINDIRMIIHYWTPEGTSIGAMTVDAVRLVLTQKGDWEPSPPVLALQNCEVDAITDLVRTENIEKLDEECFTLTATPSFHMCHIGFNIRPDQSYRRPEVGTNWPLADVEFRHALFHGYDQEGITATIYGYTVTPIHSLVPPAQSGWYNPAVPEHAFNTGNPFTSEPGEHTTVGIFMAAGYTFIDADSSGTVTTPDYWVMPNGGPLPRMVIWTPTLEQAPISYQYVAEFIADLAEVGLKATPENGQHGLINVGADFYLYTEKVFWQADFDGYLLCHLLGVFPTHLYSMIHSSQDCKSHPGGGNAPGIIDPELDALTETLLFSLDHNSKIAACHEAQSRLYDPSYPLCAFAYMNLYSRNRINAFKPGLGGAIDSPGYATDNMWTFLNMHWQPGHPNERIEDGKSTIIWCLNDEPQRFNPLYSYTSYTWKILDQVYDPLAATNPYTHQDEPWLATDWMVMETPGTGAMEVTFWLGEDICWQDGNPYTAEDAKFNWLFLRDNQIPRYASMWEHIVDVEVIDTYTVKVYVDVASQWLFYDLKETAALLPPAVWSAWDGRPLEEILGRDLSLELGWNGVTPTNLFGTGPFVFDFYEPVTLVAELHANRQYFKITAGLQDQLVEMFWACGDVNRDGIVDQVDKDRYEAACWSMPGDPNWDPDCDLNSDGIIDIRDGVIIACFFGKTREVHKAICYISVIVDIKPSSWPNPIQLRDNGMLTVAILGSEEFNVTSINPETIRITREGLETEIGVEPIRWGYEDLKKQDGYLDLTLQFDNQDLITKLELDQFADQTIPLIITGYLKEEYDLRPIRGQDFVLILD